VTFITWAHVPVSTQMRRDHFTLTVDETGAVAPPTLVLAYEGPAGSLTDRLTEDGGLIHGELLDASFRVLDADHDGDEDEPIDAFAAGSGVFSLTHRLTGEYILEAGADPADVRTLIDAAQAEGGSYRIRIERPDEEDVVFVTEALLVYDVDGNLRRKDSLIPSGVEL